MTEQDYVAAVLAAYVALPDTACQPRRADRVLAHSLFAEGVPLDVVLDALLLADARRHLNPASPPAPVRSLHYFLPVIRELAALDAQIRAMLRASLQRHACRMALTDPTPPPETYTP
ncbi:MAG: hypothetical protein PHE83_18790 [Opitutaceae bacterium]|nr:hypothetical protein [Opitutaceae bacterium]